MPTNALIRFGFLTVSTPRLRTSPPGNFLSQPRLTTTFQFLTLETQLTGVLTQSNRISPPVVLNDEVRKTASIYQASLLQKRPPTSCWYLSTSAQIPLFIMFQVDSPGAHTEDAGAFNFIRHLHLEPQELLPGGEGLITPGCRISATRSTSFTQNEPALRTAWRHDHLFSEV